MSSFRSLGKDIIAYGVMSGISKSVNLVLLPVLTRQFSTSEYGIIDVISILTSLLSLIIALSLESAVMRFWFESKKKDELSKLISSSLIFVLGTGILIIFLIYLFSGTISVLLLDSSENWIYVFLGACSALFMALKNIPLVALRMQRRIIGYNSVNLIQSLLYVGLALLLIFKFQQGLISVFIALAISHAIAFIIGLLMNRRLIKAEFSLSFLKPSLKYSLPMFPAVFVTWLNQQADRFLLLLFLGLGAVGIFGASAKIVMIIALLVTIFRQAWTPLSINALDKEETERNQFYEKVFKLYFIGMFTIGIIIVLFSRPLLDLLVPVEYHTGYVIIPWLIGAMVLHGSASITNLGTVISKKTGANSIAAWTGAFTNICLGLLLIPKFGIAGAAIGSFIAELFFTLILWKKSIQLTSVYFSIPTFIIVVLLYINLSLVILYYPQLMNIIS
ncbi:MAG: oligosaccharide flippase family protein [Balneola sp.]|jgi:O-antigen/teichoic acid export membrane protein